MSRLNAMRQRVGLITAGLRAPESARQPITLFIHTPSTGGTTMYGLLQAVYGTERTLRISAESYGANQLMAARVLTQQPYAYDAIIVHALLHEKPTVRGREARLLTLLREPAQRVISNIYRVRNNPKHPFHARISATSDPIQAIMTLRDNVHIRHLAGVHPDAPVTPDDLARAQSRLTEWFTVAGITERYDESLLLMKRRLGWQAVPPIERRNVGGHRPAALADEVYAAARERSALDCTLYDFAVSRFDAQIQAEGASFQDELTEWRNSTGVGA
jgi:hypothetical protein